MEIPVFLFTGFLESGKTTFLRDTLEDKRFNSGEKTLVILCEEGIEEIDLSKIPHKNKIFIEVLEKEDISKGNLNLVMKRYNAERVLLEYNGMWDMAYLYENLPDSWLIYQHINFANASDILSYNANMRNIVADKLQGCDMTVFNRIKNGMDTTAFHKLVRALNRRCDIIYEYEDGQIIVDEIEDPLPFDINADIINIEDRDFAIWYANLVEKTKDYIGKTVRFKGIVARDKSLDDKTFVIGRHVMTCCEADIAYRGVICIADSPVGIKNRDWKTVTAKVEIGRHKVYRGEGPILKMISAEDAEKPEDEVATFY